MDKEPREKAYKYMSTQVDMVCLDLFTLNMLILGTETDDATKVTAAVQLIKAAIKKQGYDDVMSYYSHWKNKNA